MIRYIVISVASGLIFGILDGVINANPLAQRLYNFYQPIARTSVNVPAGLVIDLVYGFIISGIFLLLYKNLPGDSGLVKGICFALLIWFFRVVMSMVSQWMMLNVPLLTMLYSILAGLGEMIILGILYGLTLRPL